MASSFKGWGESWGVSWGGDTPSGSGDMFGMALFSISATGTLTNGAQQEVIAPWPSLPIPMRKIPRKPREEDEALLLVTIL